MAKQAEFWDGRAEAYDANIQKHKGRYEEIIAITKALLKPEDRVLDFACASGEISLALASAVSTLQGIDLSKRMIELAQQKAEQCGCKNATFKQLDLFDAQLEPKSFSVVIAFNIFHLLPNTAKTLERLQLLLKDGGLLVSKTPCLKEQNIFFRMLLYFAGRTGLTPQIKSFSAKTLETAISRNFDIGESKRWSEKHAAQWIIAKVEHL